jgi:hypothetical protein
MTVDIFGGAICGKVGLVVNGAKILEPSEARSLAHKLWRLAADAERQERDSAGDEGPWLVVYRVPGGWERCTIPYAEKWRADFSLGQLLGNGDAVSGEVISAAAIMKGRTA